MNTSLAVRLSLSTALLAALLAALPAAAQSSATDQFQVSATVIAKCSIAAADVSIGDYDPMGANFAAPKDASGTITVNCTKGAAYSVGIDGGQNSAQASGTTRAMRHSASAEYLSYELYTDATRSDRWGTAVADRVSGTGVGHATAVPLTVYVRVPAGQEPTQGSYTDLVNATVYF
jgi:spore coat protein U-like protein